MNKADRKVCILLDVGDGNQATEPSLAPQSLPGSSAVNHFSWSSRARFHSMVTGGAEELKFPAFQTGTPQLLFRRRSSKTKHHYLLLCFKKRGESSEK